MGNFFGLGDQVTSDIRLNGIGWVGAILVVGATILTARFLISWQVRRLERLLTLEDKDANGGDKGDRGQGGRSEKA